MNNNYDYNAQFEPIRFESFGYTPPQPPRKQPNGLAIAALVLGILSLVFTCCCCCLYYLNILIAPLAILFACLSKHHTPTHTMNTMAKVALVLAIIGLLLFIAFVAIEIYAWNLPDGEWEKLIRSYIEDFYDMTFEEYWNDIEMETGA